MLVQPIGYLSVNSPELFSVSFTLLILSQHDGDDVIGDTFTLEVPVVIRLTCVCAVADDAVMPIRTESSS